MLTLFFTILGVIFGLLKGTEKGLVILVMDGLVLVPVLICSNYFFPERAHLGLSRARSGDE